MSWVGFELDACEFLQTFLRKSGYTRCIEVGMATGSTSLVICSVLAESNDPEATLVSIDPFQHSGYDDMATAALQEAGLERFSQVSFESSHEALPKLLPAAPSTLC